MNQTKLKLISTIVGGLGIIVAGLVYILIGDMMLLSKAQWLFAGIFFAFGSGFFVFFPESVKNKKTLFIVFKGLAICFSICFIVVVLLYCSQIDYHSLYLNKQYTTKKIDSILTVLKISTLLFAVSGVACQAGNLGLNIHYGIDD